MAWIYILTIVLLLVLLLLFAPITLSILYNENLKVKISVFGFKINVPQPTAAIDNHKNSSNKFNPLSSAKKIYNILRKQRILNILSLVSKMLNTSFKVWQKLMSKISINKLKILIIVGSDSAFSTSIKYGQISSLIYPIVSTVSSVCTPKKLILDIRPNFLKEKIKIDFELNINSCVFRLIPIFFTLIKELKTLL